MKIALSQNILSNYLKGGREISALTLLALMILLPGTGQLFKLTALIYLFLYGLFEILIKRMGFFPRHQYLMVKWTIYYSSIGFFYFSLGLIYNNPGSTSSFNPYVVYPFILLALVYGLSRRDCFEKAHVVVTYSGLVAAAYGITAAAATLSLIPYWMYVDIGVMTKGNGVVVHEDSIGIGISTLIPMLFIVPYLISVFLLWIFDGVKLGNIYVLVFTLALCFIFIILTGRRTAVVVTALAPVIFIFFRIFRSKVTKKKRNYRNLLAAIFMTGFIFHAFFQKTDAIGLEFADRFSSILAPSADSSISHKKNQTELMFEGWENEPLLGHGFGAVVEGVKSSEDEPWAYESTYPLLLHNSGIVGFLAYSLGILWIYWQSIKIIKRDVVLRDKMIPVMTGFTSFIIANSTNPYLGQLDTLWVLAFPLTFIITHYIIKNEKFSTEN